MGARAAKNYIFNKPLCVSFEITYSCNAHCKHCHLGGPAEETRASASTLGKICRDIRPVIAQLSGGEPLLRPDVDDIAREFRRQSRPPVIAVTTNGALLSLRRYLELRDAGVDEFSVSLDYPDERHDEFRGIPGLFGKIRTLVRSVGSTKAPSVTLCCVIQSDNFRELVRIAELARRWNVRLNYSAYTTLRTHDTGYMLSSEQLEELRAVVKDLVAFRNRYRTIYTSEYVFEKICDYFASGSMAGCRTGYRFFNVNPNGKVTPCGLIATEYEDQKDLQDRFCRKNTCSECCTSIRAHTEKPIRHVLRDSLEYVH